MKRIISLIIITAILTTSVLFFSSCDKPEIYNLIEALISKNDGSSEFFTAELNIKINKDYLYTSGILSDFKNAEFDAVPNEINFKFSGELKHVSESKYCSAAISVQTGELLLGNPSLTFFSSGIYCVNDSLYFENNEMTRIILDLLTATGFVDFPVKQIFSEIAYTDTDKLFYIDLKDFDLSWFEQYAEQIEKTFTINSKFDISKEQKPNLTAKIPVINNNTLLDFNDIKSQTETQLLKVKGYRYAELSIILSSDDYIYILASRENGKRELLEPVKSDIRLRAAIAKINREPAALWTENIIPMRYILELLGEDVNWDNAAKKPYIVRKGENVHFNAAIVNSRSYINLTQILSTALYAVSTGETGDYLEFKIMRQYLSQ